MTGLARRMLVSVFVALTLAVSAAQGPVTRGPLASRRLTAGPIVTLDLPTNDAAAFGAVTAVLSAARVPFGAEGPALDWSVPIMDFAAPSKAPLALTGLTVGDALDAIVRVCPRLHWTEQDGVIIARATNRDSVLDRRLRTFAVTTASPRTALEAIVGELAPDRVSMSGVAGVASNDAVMAAVPRDGKDVTLSLTNISVADAMTAVARANGAMSWVVRYEKAPANMANAYFRFTESRRFVVAGKPEPPPPPGPRPNLGTPDLSRILFRRDIASMLAVYGKAAHVALGIEPIPRTEAAGFVNGIDALDLRGFSPDKAVALLVGYDSRYTFKKRGDRFVIYPRVASAGASILDAKLPKFARSKESLDSLVAGLLSQIGASDVRAPMIRPIRDPLPAGTLDAVNSTPISVSVGRDTPAREVLDEICAAAGSLSWSLPAPVSSGIGTTMSLRLHLESPAGWQYDRLFSMPATAVRPVRPAGATLPAAMDRDIDRVYLSSTAPPGARAFVMMAAAARVPAGVEAAPEGPDPDGRLTTRTQAMPAQVGPGRFSDALYAALDRERGYELFIVDGVINLAPAGSAARPDHFLNQPLGAFHVTDLTTARTVLMLRLRLAHQDEARAMTEPLRPMMPDLEQKISLDLPNPTARDVLNEIARRNTGVAWLVRYQSKNPASSGQVREEDCIIEVTALRPGGAPPVAFTHTGEPPRPPAPPRPAPPPTGSRVTMGVPLTARSETELIHVCRGLGITCTFEGVAPPQMRTAIGPPPAGTYDFTGLSGRDALDRLVMLAPELIWSRDGEIYRVRSRAIAEAADLPLDRRIPAIDRQLQTVSDIFHLVVDLMDPSVAAHLDQPAGRPPTTVTMSVGGLIGPSSPNDRLVTLRMKDVTIRQILDEIARQHGGINWAVRYLETNGLYPEMMLTLSGDSFGQGQGITIRK